MIDINLTDMLFAIANFVILIVILNKFLHKPVLSMLEKRKKFVQDNLEASTAAKVEAEKIREEYLTEMKHAREEAQGIIEQATKVAEKEKNDIIATAKTETKKISEEMHREIQAEKDKAMAEVRHIIVSTSILAAEKIVARNLDAKDHEKMIDDFIKEVGEVH